MDDGINGCMNWIASRGGWADDGWMDWAYRASGASVSRSSVQRGGECRAHGGCPEHGRRHCGRSWQPSPVRSRKKKKKKFCFSFFSLSQSSPPRIRVRGVWNEWTDGPSGQRLLDFTGSREESCACEVWLGLVGREKEEEWKRWWTLSHTEGTRKRKG